ncbi:hypothetical protein D3C84_597860 [compost metagenome]
MLELLRVPATTVLFHHRGVLRAVEQTALVELGHALVAANALTDVLGTALLDLLREERVGNGRARCTNEVCDTAAHQADHVIRAGVATVGHHRHIADHALNILDERQHPARLAKTRGRSVFAPFLIVADLHRPQVTQAFLVHKLDDANTLIAGLDAVRALQGIDLVAGGDGTAVAALLLQGTHQLDEHPRAILYGATVLVGALVVAALEELHREGTVAGGHFQQVEAGILGALGRQDVHFDDGLDVVLVALGRVHGASRQQVGRQARGRARHFAGFKPRRVHAAVPQLHAGEAVMLVNLIAHGA